MVEILVLVAARFEQATLSFCAVYWQEMAHCNAARSLHCALYVSGLLHTP